MGCEQKLLDLKRLRLMVFSAIVQQLRQSTGLDPDIIGANRIARAIEGRRLDCGLPDLERYWTRLQTSTTELEELVEQLIVPETWFFRDGKPFEYLKTYATSEWLLKPNRNTLRLLSVPCSTGEEPYSMAIALLEAGLLPRQFAIDAMDISHRSIAKANRAVYTKNSFRGDAWTGRERYFQQTIEGYELCQPIRTLVNFQPGNVMTSLALTQKQYDIIFCRNLLIYLQPEACSKVLAVIDRLLLPGGLLFVGASETGKIVADHYCSIRQPFTFAYRKLEVTRSPQLAVPQRTIETSLLPDAPPQTEEQRIERCSELGSEYPNQSLNLQTLDLQTVKLLADAGRLADAIALCQAYLVNQPTDAAAYLLLGELYQADRQNNAAQECFRRAVYLEPNSDKALIHLALLKQHQGDIAGAEMIQQRIQRLQYRLRTVETDSQKG